MTVHLRKDIQQLRGIAILLVVAYHAGGVIPSGFVGVDVFFVISGFVIARSVSARVGRGDFSLGHFWAQRIRRILPALGLTVFIITALSTWMSPISARVQTVRTGAFAILGSANLFLFRFRPDGYFETSEKSNALLNTWSLSIEEQFYLCFSVLITVTVRKCIKKDWLKVSTWICGLLGVVSLLSCIYVSVAGSDFTNSRLMQFFGSDRIDARFAFYMPLTRAWEFLIGTLLGLNWHLFVQRIRYFQQLRIVGLIMVTGASLALPISQFPGAWAVVPVIGTTLVLLSNSSNGLVSGRIGAVLAWLGDCSYGWYLWHWPILQFVSPFSTSLVVQWVAVGLAVVPAWLSFRFLEEPIRHSGYWKSKRKTLSIAFVSLSLPWLAISTAMNPQLDLEQHRDVEMGCIYGEIDRLGVNGPCLVRSSGSMGVAALIGDSHASHLSEAFVTAANALSLDALLASRANSPFLFLEGVASDGSNFEQRQMIEHLKTLNVVLVVVAQSNYPITFDVGRTWEDGMRPVLRELTNSGIKVVLVAESLIVEENPLACSALQISFSACKADISIDTESLLSRRRRHASELRLEKEFSSVVLFDSARYMCPESTCPVRRDGHWWWRDGGHISVYASRQLSTSLQEKMQSVIDS